VKKNHAILIYN